MTKGLVCREDAGHQALALRWGAEQLEGARQALSAARGALKKLKAIEKKRKQKVSLLHCCLPLLHRGRTTPMPTPMPKALFLA